jgi:regulatory protein
VETAAPFLYFRKNRLYARIPMPSSLRKISSDDELYAAAVHALARRPHSVHEMRLYLERRAADANAVARIMTRLKEHKYLHDARYARQFVRNRAEVRRQGKFRIARDLRARGVPDKYIESALEEMGHKVDEGEVVRTRIARRLKTLRGPFDQRRAASLMQSLLRAGFSSETIRREIRTATKAEIPETPNESCSEE